MGETLPLFKTSFNQSVQIESRPDHLTGDAGALVQREIMERTGIIDWLSARLHDPRNPDLITYPLSDLLRTIYCYWVKDGAIRTMRTGCGRILPCGWPTALFVVPCLWRKTMCWLHNPRFPD